MRLSSAAWYKFQSTPVITDERTNGVDKLNELYQFQSTPVITDERTSLPKQVWT